MNELLRRFGHAIVDADYRFDPTTEDIIYGEELADGMVVLVERDYRSADSSIGDMFRDVNNRWCEVSKLRQGVGEGRYYFVGLYADGQKAVRSSGSHYGWLVKLDLSKEDKAASYNPEEETDFDDEGDANDIKAYQVLHENNTTNSADGMKSTFENYQRGASASIVADVFRPASSDIRTQS